MKATYVGIVHVRVGSSGETEQQVISISTSALGVRIRNGLTAGFLADRSLVIPMDCRLIVLVRTEAQLHEAARVLATLPEDICTARDATLF